MTKPWSDMTPHEQDAALAELMGYTTILADGGFGETVYLHDTGARRTSPGVTENCHLLGARWERIRVDGDVCELFVCLCPPYTSDYAAIQLVEDEIERQGLQERYIEVLDKLIEYERDKGWTWFRWGILRATPAQRAEAAYTVLREQHATP